LTTQTHRSLSANITTTQRTLYSQATSLSTNTVQLHVHEPHLKRAENKSRMSIENLKTFDPFAEADEDTGQVKQNQQDYIHIRIQRKFVVA
jgi:hypothetical protein